jgi:hypothetical protein
MHFHPEFYEFPDVQICQVKEGPMKLTKLLFYYQQFTTVICHMLFMVRRLCLLSL